MSGVAHYLDRTFRLHQLKWNENLRVAYIDHDKPSKRWWSVLIRFDSAANAVNEVYRVELPGDPVGGKGLVGEKKPNNQNHALPFTRGSAVQAIDMNMDMTFEDAVKMRCLQEEFENPAGAQRGIAGCREHVFTDNVSSLANFMGVWVGPSFFFARLDPPPPHIHTPHTHTSGSRARVRDGDSARARSAAELSYALRPP